MNEVQMAFSVGITKSVMDFQANMAAQLISGGTAGNAQTQSAPVARDAGLAAEGIGSRLNVTA